MAQLLGVLEQGLIYAVLALGVYITFKILDFPDMTVDSSFPLGAAVTALMISNGVNPLLTLPASLLAGAAAGALTGVIHVRFHVRDLLSGIIMMTGLYSVNPALCPRNSDGARRPAGQGADGCVSRHALGLSAPRDRR